ncbi:CLM5 protein, partial [Anseranas semipalmata]|nr:CLM5 protein [Anseranas semipalmata]
MELSVLLLLPLCFPGLQAQTPHAQVSQREGSNLSVLFPYHPAQINYQEMKAWWRVIRGERQLVVATIDSTQYPYTDRAKQGHVTIQDDPARGNMSVTMTDLQVEDSGTYSCTYSHSYLPLKTISLNVFKELHTREMDSLSVQCPYRALGFSSGRKAWCRRLRQTRCDIVVSTVHSSSWDNNKVQNKRTSIQDDIQKGILTITVEKLQAQDSGVYWCALYRTDPQLQFTRLMEVRLSVAKVPDATTLPLTTGTSPEIPPGNSTLPRSYVNTFIAISVVLYILFMLGLTIFITLCIRQHKKLKRRGNRQAEDTYDKPEDTTQFENTERMGSPKDDSKDLKYVTLDFKSQLSPEEPLYCNVEPNQAPTKPNNENVEYAIIALS